MQIFPLAFTNTYMQVGEGTNQKRMTQDAPYESGLFLFKKKRKKAMDIWEQNTLLGHYLSFSSRDQRLLEIPNFCRTYASKVNVSNHTSSLLNIT